MFLLVPFKRIKVLYLQPWVCFPSREWAVSFTINHLLQYVRNKTCQWNLMTEFFLDVMLC